MKTTKERNVTSILVNKDILKEAKIILKESGVSIRRFVEIALQSLIDSERIPASELYGRTAQRLLDTAGMKVTKKKK